MSMRNPNRTGGDKRSAQQQNKRMRVSRAVNGKGGKGSWNRTTNNSKYRLGMELIRVAEEFGHDSTEYREALERWRNA